MSKMRATAIATFVVIGLLSTRSTEGFSLFGGRDIWQQQQQQQTTKVRKETRPPPPPPLDAQFRLPTVQLPELDLPEVEIPNPVTPNAWNSMTSSVLAFAANFAPKELRQTSDRAARVSVNRLPPQSFQVDLTDVPVIGKPLSGTYAKVKSDAIREPSIIIASPKDKVGALETAADTGNLQFGLQRLLSTVLDIQFQPNQPGVAPVEVKSPLIPKWPFGNRRSAWNKVTNMGNGQAYYFNEKTGETQTEDP